MKSRPISEVKQNLSRDLGSSKFCLERSGETSSAPS